MRRMFLKDGSYSEITENEFSNAIKIAMNGGWIIIDRLQLAVTAFEVAKFEAIPNQFEYGHPYLLLNDKKIAESFRRYFLDHDGKILVSFSQDMGKKALGSLEEYKSKLVSEDEYIDYWSVQDRIKEKKLIAERKQLIEKEVPQKGAVEGIKQGQIAPKQPKKG